MMQIHEDATEPLDADLDRLAVLADPVRRQLYRYVAGQDAPQSRDQVAEAVGVAHHVAKFHLDKLAAEGLLDVEYRRPPGRRGPGAGRPTKLYSRGRQSLSVQVPARSYDLAGTIMADAIEVANRTGTPIADTLRQTARQVGRRMAAEERRGRRGGHNSARQLKAVADVLAKFGFEPRIRDKTLTLANCPFHDVAQAQPAVVCGMNAELVAGVVEALDAAELQPQLQPGEHRCCVTIHAK